MSLKDEETDVEFVENLFQELILLKLPRTLLLALTSVGEYLHRGGTKALFDGVSLQSTLNVVQAAIARETEELADGEFDEEVCRNILSTIDTLFKIVSGLSLHSGQSSFMKNFLDFLNPLMGSFESQANLGTYFRETISQGERLVAIGLPGSS